MPRACSTLFVIAGLVACDEAAPSHGGDRDARALLADVRARDYPHWTSDTTEGDAPHGSHSTVFLDPALEAALAGPSIEAWPDGVTVVCEGRADAEADLELLMIMRKQQGAWSWAQYDAEDEPLVAGTAVGCVHCHAAGHDFLRTVKLP